MEKLIDSSLIKVGAFLKTRDGRKVEILRADMNNRYPVVGIITDFSGNQYSFVCTSEGTIGVKRSVCGLDLISEWTEPVTWDWSNTPDWLNWLSMDKNGEWWLYSDKPDKFSCIFNGSLPCAIPESHEPTYTGTWENSLTQRPQP